MNRLMFVLFIILWPAFGCATLTMETPVEEKMPRRRPTSRYTPTPPKPGIWKPVLIKPPTDSNRFVLEPEPPPGPEDYSAMPRIEGATYCDQDSSGSQIQITIEDPRGKKPVTVCVSDYVDRSSEAALPPVEPTDENTSHARIKAWDPGMEEPPDHPSSPVARRTRRVPRGAAPQPSN